MATLDELANRISVLENRYSTLNSVVNGHATEIHNLDTRLDTCLLYTSPSPRDCS